MDSLVLVAAARAKAQLYIYGALMSGTFLKARRMGCVIVWGTLF